MSTSELIVIIFLALIAAACVTSVLILNLRHKAKQKTDPSRHRGEFQSQKGRVYSDAPTHSATPGSGT